MQRSNVAEIVNDDLPETRETGHIPIPSGTSDVGDLWRILACRRALVLAVVLFFGIGALLYLIVARTEFTATAQLLIDPRDRQIVLKDVTPDTLAADGGVLQVESLSRVIESDAVLLRAVKALDLAHDADYGADKTGLLAKLLTFVTGADEDDGPSAAENRALRVLRKHLALKRADKVFVIDIIVTAYSGGKAARLADAIAEAFMADQVQSRADSSSRASKALVSRLEELRASVRAAAEEVERFKAAHDLLGTEKQLISDQQLNDNGTQLNNARAKVAELQARVDQLDSLRRSGADEGAVTEAIQSSVITQLRASQSELTRRRSDMRTRFGDRYPDLIALDAEINQTHRLINAELDRLARSAHSDLDRARKNVQALAGSQDALKQNTISNNQAFTTLQELVRELEARQSVYQAFLSRADETKAQSGIDSTNARIISRAIPPVLPSWPLRAIVMLGAVGGGLGLGIALAFVAEYVAPTLVSAGQLEAAADVPVVGTIAAGSRLGKAPAWSRRRKAAAATATNVALRLALNRLCGPLGALKGKPKPHSVLVVSARGLARPPGDIAARLVGAAAETNASVLLVEADPGATGSAEAKGLVDVMNGESELKSAVTRDSRTGIFRLGMGKPASNRLDVLTSERLKQFILLAGRNFDLIIFNGGNVIENFAAAPLASVVDDVLFVALRGVTPRKEAAETADAVAASAGRPLSAALLVDSPDRL